MSSETLTLTKALVELKLLTKRIDKKIATIDPVAVKRGDRFEAAIKSREEFEAKVKADWQSLRDLQARRRKIKSAVVLANARTEVTIIGEKMTIAEAIEQKNIVDMEKTLCDDMREKLLEHQRTVDKHNKDMEDKLVKLLESTYAKRETQLSKEDHDRIAKPFRASKEAKLVDPLDLEKTIKELEERCEQFLAEVDVALSVSNATTNITI